MTTLRQNALLTELESEVPLSPGTRAFLGQRTRNAFFNFIHEKLREARENGLTQATLARRIGKDPGRLSNTLGSPGNWTIDTVAELLFGICRAELVLDSQPLLGRPPINSRATDLLGLGHSQTSPLDALTWASPPASGSARVVQVNLESEPAL